MDKLICNLSHKCGLQCYNAIPHVPDAECINGLCDSFIIAGRRQRCECVTAYGYRADDADGLQRVTAAIVAVSRDKEK